MRAYLSVHMHGVFVHAHSARGSEGKNYQAPGLAFNNPTVAFCHRLL